MLRQKGLRCVLMLACCATAHAQGQSARIQITNAYQFRVEATVASLDERREVGSYERHGAVSGTIGSRLGFGAIGKDHPIEVSIEPRLKNRRFVVDVTLNPIGGDDTQITTHDVNDVRPLAIDLTEDNDGRSYWLNLIPSVEEIDLERKPFAAAADDLYRLHFSGSRVILNNDQYVGQVLASDSEVFNLDICGVASIDFSLRRLKNAEPIGQLQAGKIFIGHPGGDSIEIGNVTNGEDRKLVAGGPYTVWARWEPPTQTVAEHREALDALMKRVDAGEFEGRPSMRSRVQAELARAPGPWVVSSSARGLRADEVVVED